MDRLACADASARHAYSRLLAVQRVSEIATQSDSLDYMGHVLAGCRRAAAEAAQLCRQFPKMRSANRPTTHATVF